MADDGQRDARREWVVPIAALASTALAAFGAFYVFDYYLFSPPPDPSGNALDFYLRFDPDKITDATGSLAAMVAAVFGIVITVVSIIVQLSADRYTGVARMFLHDRTNLSVMGYYLLTTLYGMWLSMSLKSGFAPRTALVAMLVASTIALVLMAPYFGYVFWFLEPMNIIRRIWKGAVKVAADGASEHDGERCSRAQADTLGAMEELTDITSNSISGKDKIIASGAVDALKDLALEYLARKPRATATWFEIGERIRKNPDFVAMDPESLADLEARKTWVEWKVMREYLGIYNEALVSMRDINYLIAIDTRYIGEAAGAARDDELLRLVFRFMNSYLRSTLNAREVRTAYNVLNQYRLLVETMIRQGHHDLAFEAVQYLLYYGHVSFDMKLTFVTETVAYDVSTVCQIACDVGSPCEERMLAEFLELDRPLRVRSQEKALLGVRKAQVKLASYYLMRGNEAKARMICDDMRDEPPDRRLQIQEQLEKVGNKDFWEIIDRGRNFEYMPPEQRAELGRFFSWFASA
ncbi:MAG: DUF2254 domain-containing protein [Polyangiaceae bacterium]|nr:DUF2254 domain-containing protein [Polyangiaceae bacterium]